MCVSLCFYFCSLFVMFFFLLLSFFFSFFLYLSVFAAMAEDEADGRPAVIKQYEPTYLLKPHEHTRYDCTPALLHTLSLFFLFFTFSLFLPLSFRRFYPSEARKVCEDVVMEVVGKQEWRGEEETVWSVQIAEKVKARIKSDLAIPRYKIVVQVTLGEMKNQGVRVASKCLWDADADNYASFSFRNESLWCCVMVFCCYTE